jgi:hypothetical protein
MIWLTWRQSRLESLIGGVVLALVAAYLLWTGNEMVSYFRHVGLPACLAQTTNDAGCRDAILAFEGRFDLPLRGVKMLIPLCIPFLLGLLLAAPTALEFDQGTYRLAWTQSVTRRRWLVTKIAYGLAIVAGASALLTSLSTWWIGPFDDLYGRFANNSFEVEGTAPIAYAVFAFALCLALGTLLRRTIPAVGIGFVVFLVARGVVADQLRPRYLEPVRRTWDRADQTPPVAAGDNFSNHDWLISEGFFDARGHYLSRGDEPVRSCMGDTASKFGDLFDDCLRDHGIMYTIAYHPADRFWVFQAIETALFLGLAAGLLGLTYWWVTRRIA